MAKKIFPYAVIWGGEIIPANTPIEVEEEKPVTDTEDKKPVTKTVTEDKKPKKRGDK